jgi:hypothetical protein
MKAGMVEPGENAHFLIFILLVACFGGRLSAAEIVCLNILVGVASGCQMASLR